MKYFRLLLLVLISGAIPNHVSAQKLKSNHLPEFKVDDYSIGLYRFFEILDDYMKNRIGVIDSMEWSNNEEGEVYEATLEFHLEDGHSILHHTYYEHWQTTYVFRNVKVKEIYALLEALLKQADLYDETRMKELKEKRNVVMGLEDLCCYLEIETKEDEVVLTFLPSE